MGPPPTSPRILVSATSSAPPRRSTVRLPRAMSSAAPPLLVWLPPSPPRVSGSVPAADRLDRDQVTEPMSEPIRTLTLDELAAEAAAPTELLERLVELGQLRRDGDGRFDARDVAIIATVQALEGAGGSADDLVWLIQKAGGGYQAVGRMFTTPGPRVAPTYRHFLASLGPLGSRV